MAQNWYFNEFPHVMGLSVHSWKLHCPEESIVSSQRASECMESESTEIDLNLSCKFHSMHEVVSDMRMFTIFMSYHCMLLRADMILAAELSKTFCCIWETYTTSCLEHWVRLSF